MIYTVDIGKIHCYNLSHRGSLRAIPCAIKLDYSKAGVIYEKRIT